MKRFDHLAQFIARQALGRVAVDQAHILVHGGGCGVLDPRLLDRLN
jgi:hypothetical protein